MSSAGGSSHRTSWFIPDRPVEGTVHVRPGQDPIPTDEAVAELRRRAQTEYRDRDRAVFSAVVAEIDRLRTLITPRAGAPSVPAPPGAAART